MRSGNTVNIVQQIGTHYSTLGSLLLEDDTGSITKAIFTQFQLNAVMINQDILTQWLQGQGKKPVAWSTLIDTLKDAELSELAQMIEEELGANQIQALEEKNAELQQQLETCTQQLNMAKQKVCS